MAHSTARNTLDGNHTEGASVMVQHPIYGLHQHTFQYSLATMMQEYLPGTVRLLSGAPYCPHFPRHPVQCPRPRRITYTTTDGHTVVVTLPNYTTMLYFLQAYIDHPS